jgi:serine/threonine protein kinase
MAEIDSPHVVKLLDSTKTASNYYLALEYCNGGDLQNYMLARGKHLVEEEARLIFRQIISGMAAIKAKDVIHRDLKLPNILCHFTDLQDKEALNVYLKKFDFKEKHASLVVKIADLGFSRKLQENEVAVTGCGTPLMMAPEIYLAKGYGHKADVWSLGCIFYELLIRKVPFPAKTVPDLIRQL